MEVKKQSRKNTFISTVETLTKNRMWIFVVFIGYNLVLACLGFWVLLMMAAPETKQEMIDAARFIVERMKLVVEPSAATVLAAMRRLGDRLAGRRVGAVLSGGNTDFAWYANAAGS